jgi:hypothetical protein
MALPNPSPGDSIAANDIDEIRVHLTGQSGKTEAYHLRQSSGNALITLATADGSNGFRINDSAGVQVFYVDSDGNVTQAGSFTPGSITLPGSASAAPTTEGQIMWDTDDNRIVVGDGSTTKTFYPGAPTDMITKRKTAETQTVISSTTLVNDDTLVQAIGANETWVFLLGLFFTSASAAGVIAAIDVPASATMTVVGVSAQGTSGVGAATTSDAGQIVLASTTNGADPESLVYVYVANSSNAGNVQLQWAQQVSTASNTLLRTGSFMTGWRL